MHSLWLGAVSAKEAKDTAGKVDHWLMRIKQGLVTVPAWCGIVDFVRHDGKPPEPSASPAPAAAVTLSGLRDAYLESQRRKLEPTTIDGMVLHFGHLVRLIGGEKLITSIARPVVQRYVDARSAEWIDPNVYRRARDAKRKSPAPPAADKPMRHPSSATIKKEVVTLRTAWNWGRRQLGIVPEFPGAKLDYAKTHEALPFMTWDEAERRVKAGDDADAVWGSVYLRPSEVAEMLEWVKGRPVSPWVYPIFCIAAHTGARRSEIVRIKPSDVDLVGEVLTIREKKRDKSRLTIRRVPMTPLLKTVLADWLSKRGKGKSLICKANGDDVTPREAMNYFTRALRKSKWKVVRGLHTLRHSYISALANKGVDQRIIDELAGHQTEQQRRRYRHLYQKTLTDAVKGVFG